MTCRCIRGRGDDPDVQGRGPGPRSGHDAGAGARRMNGAVGVDAEAPGARGRRPHDPRPGRRDPGAGVPAVRRGRAPGRGVVPRRRLGHSATSTRTTSSCRQLCDAVGAIVVSVDYRLAPEAKFPAAARRLRRRVRRGSPTHAGELGGDPTRVAIGGDSAGGNLAAVACLVAREARLPAAGAPAARVSGHRLRVRQARR